MAYAIIETWPRIVRAMATSPQNNAERRPAAAAVWKQIVQY